MSQTNLRATESGKNRDFGGIFRTSYKYQLRSLVTQEPVIKGFIMAETNLLGARGP